LILILAELTIHSYVLQCIVNCNCAINQWLQRKLNVNNFNVRAQLVKRAI